MPRGPVWGLEDRSGLPFRYDPYDREHGGPPAPARVDHRGHGRREDGHGGHAVGEYLTAERPPEAIIIDPKSDYTRMATALGGTVVALSEEPAHAINCMDLAPPPAAERIGRTHNAVREGITRTLGFVALACATEGSCSAPRSGRW